MKNEEEEEEEENRAHTHMHIDLYKYSVLYKVYATLKQTHTHTLCRQINAKTPTISANVCWTQI